MRCSCGAGHQTFGQCMRAKNIRVGYSRSAAGLDYTAEKQTQRELALYADTRRQGIQPSGTTTAASRAALEISDVFGRAYDAANPTTVLEV